MNAIETRGLSKAYGGRRVVSDFDMTVAAGDIYGFVGKNGAGKSTVMKMICGVAAPSGGEVVLFGGALEGSGAGSAPSDTGVGDLVAGSAAVRRIGVLIEEPGLLPNLSAYRNLMAKALAWGIVDAPARCEEVLRLVGLQGAGKRKVRGFSLGMKQRLGLALALLGNPDVLLLDEPFNGLDPEATRAMRNLIVRLNQTLGITVVVSSHVLDQLDRMATRYGVIADGRLVRQMSAEEMAAECGRSLRVRTADTARALALLQEAFPTVAFRAEPDGTLVATGAYDAEAVARQLQGAGQVVLEFSQEQRDIEDYFVELMEGGATHV
ncbi:ATP-binding cassette domain-containing protein [Adlercreutzia caecimuris]|uniref:ATP-binding cassette domain-containing protein n=1 Tax=Adlercreutzia caecimuris TaxID=671266 RepID=UPI001C3C2A29|nr:ATP-binding cassette domain-containing protein [Adlercreutzia caecimuris]MCR2037989.1 ATP-binding cassette domain-containing protein [Adlercreutzia caecimuris]